MKGIGLSISVLLDAIAIYLFLGFIFDSLLR